jgi:hypothetical protein
MHLPSALENSRKDWLTEPNLQQRQNLAHYCRFETENLDPKIQVRELDIFFLTFYSIFSSKHAKKLWEEIADAKNHRRA